ncbi:hypothetical protein CMT92_00160 [Elizabethkingia anophelis]|nr:hypothetical protein [Elizabethkingia anophelis]
MKKFFLLAGIASLISASVYANTGNDSDASDSLDSGGVECPSGCYGGNVKCCTTKGGSTYFTRG